jgi:hypothetical protein
MIRIDCSTEGLTLREATHGPCEREGKGQEAQTAERCEQSTCM